MIHQHVCSLQRKFLIKSPSPKSPNFSSWANGKETPTCCLYYKCLSTLEGMAIPFPKETWLRDSKAALSALEGMIPACSSQRQLWNLTCSVQGACNRGKKGRLWTCTKTGMRTGKRARGGQEVYLQPAEPKPDFLNLLRLQVFQRVALKFFNLLGGRLHGCRFSLGVRWREFV